MRSGREQFVPTDIETIRLASELLEEFEEMWRGRIDRMEEMMAMGMDEGIAGAIGQIDDILLAGSAA